MTQIFRSKLENCGFITDFAFQFQRQQKTRPLVKQRTVKNFTYVSLVGSFDAFVTRFIKTRIRSKHHALNWQQNLAKHQKEKYSSKHNFVSTITEKKLKNSILRQSSSFEDGAEPVVLANKWWRRYGYLSN